MNITEIVKQTPRNEMVERLPSREYHRSIGLNPSTIVKRRKSAKAAKHAYEEIVDPTDAMCFGSCCHTLLFEGHRFNEDWAVWPADKRRYGMEWDQFLAENEGKQIIRDGDKQYGLVHASTAVTQAIRHPFVRRLAAEGQAELSLYINHDGLQCKGRVDWISVTENALVDAKFTNDITPEKFGRSAMSLGYHIKMALYRDWFQRLSGKGIEAVYLITVETSPPYDVAVVEIPEWQLEDGLAQGRELIAKIREDVATRSFPGVDSGQDVIQLQLPPWALMERHEIEGAEEVIW